MKIRQTKLMKDMERENTGLKKTIGESTLDTVILKEDLEENTKPRMRCKCIEHLQRRLGISERWVFQVIEQPRSTQRYNTRFKTDVEALQKDIIGLTTKYGLYRCR